MNKAEFRKYYRLRRAYATLNYGVLDECFSDWTNGEIMDFFSEHYPDVNRVYSYAQPGSITYARKFSPRYIEMWQRYFREFKRLKYCESIGLTVRSNAYCMIA